MAQGSLADRVGNVVRLAEVVRVLASHGFAHLVRGAGLHQGIPARLLRDLHLLDAPEGEPATRGERLRAVLAELGPTFVKFGQVLSTRSDLLGPELAGELAGLQDRVPPAPEAEVRAQVVAELGAEYPELFASISPEPVAAASISQVYRARLPGGEEVAVKVRRPGIERVIESDLRLLGSIAEWLRHRGEEDDEAIALDPVAVFEEFARALRRELDFSVERRTLEKFGALFATTPSVFVPRCHARWSSGSVLTMDWIDGVRVDDLAAYPGRNSDPRKVARIGCDIVCTQIFEHLVFHADPHPGNLMLLRDDRIAFLDYGMVGRLSRGDVERIADLLRAVQGGDAEAATEGLLGFTATGDVEDKKALTHEVADYLAFEAEDIVAGGQIGKGLDRLTSILRRHRLELAPRVTLLVKALASIETTGRRLDPHLDVLPSLRPHVERILLSRLDPRQLAGDLEHQAADLLRLARELPDEVRTLSRLLRQGKLRLQLGHEKLGHLATVTDRASNRIAFAVISGSLIIGSSLLMTSQAAAPRLGLTGFVAAALLGLGLLVSILRSRDY